ncbi:MAG TPA: hypothetical protein VFE74_00680, partial [Ramlibacter sp.]|nr:hypothetical protein [Ramlibacter sp.]
MKRFASLAFLAALALPLSSFAQAATGPARARLDAFAQGLHSLTGHFTQTLSNLDGQDGKSSA